MKTTKSKSPATKCQARHPQTNEPICDRDVWNNGENRCILHSSEKPVDELKERFLAELKLVNETHSITQFHARCFVFPQGTDLSQANITSRNGGLFYHYRYRKIILSRLAKTFQTYKKSVSWSLQTLGKE